MRSTKGKNPPLRTAEPERSTHESRLCQPESPGRALGALSLYNGEHVLGYAAADFVYIGPHALFRYAYRRAACVQIFHYTAYLQ